MHQREVFRFLRRVSVPGDGIADERVMDGDDGAERRPFPGNLDEGRYIGNEIQLGPEQPGPRSAIDNGARNAAGAIEGRGKRRNLCCRKRPCTPLDILLMLVESKVHPASLDRDRGGRGDHRDRGAWAKSESDSAGLACDARQYSAPKIDCHIWTWALDSLEAAHRNK